MPISRRARVSLAQFLDLQGHPTLRVLLRKHDLDFDERATPLDNLANSMDEATDEQMMALVTEVVGSPRGLRAAVYPKYIYEKRWEDLKRCLELDGYLLEPSGAPYSYILVPIEPVIAGAAPVEDDLSVALNRSGLTEAAHISTLLQNSAEDFRRQPPDYNGCLANARTALQILATSIAKVTAATAQLPFNETKWGEVLAYLRTSGLVTSNEEKGVSGVFSFISPGAHTYVGVTEEEMTRLGRSLAVSMCYFLVKKHLR